MDLSFYDTHWYSEITTGSDAESCFNEGNGLGQEIAPARRDNIGDRFRPRRQQWDAGLFEGEDSCGDTRDFTVDFDNRGMDGAQGDGTDWGEDDGRRKCGRDGLGAGQWFIYARERGRVAVVGASVRVSNLLAAEGFAVDRFAANAAGLADTLRADTYDVIVISRYAADPANVSPALRRALWSPTRCGRRPPGWSRDAGSRCGRR